MNTNSVGLQLPGGPFVQLGHVEEFVWSRFSTVQTDLENRIASGSLDFHGTPEDMLQAADVLVELAGAMRDQAGRALDFRAQLREVAY